MPKQSECRKRRNSRRAAERGVGVVSADDMRAMLGMTVDDAWGYAKSHRLRIRFKTVDGVKEERFDVNGPDLVSVVVDNGRIVVTSCRHLPAERIVYEQTKST
jgi:uncharacterized protein (AIM24 family)